MTPPQISPHRLDISASAYVELEMRTRKGTYRGNSSANKPHHKEDNECNAFRGECVDDQVVPPHVNGVDSGVGAEFRPNRGK